MLVIGALGNEDSAVFTTDYRGRYMHAFHIYSSKAACSQR